MTARLVFEATLIELSKILAPSLKLYEFNYLFNKAINQYINKVYNVYDINLLTTDDLRVLKATTFLTPHKVDSTNSAIINGSTSAPVTNTGNSNAPSTGSGGTTGYTGQASSYLSTAHKSILSLRGATYEVFMPIDYLHMLNCVCIYYVAKQKDCWDAGSYIEIPAIRLTADSWSLIVTDIYNRPSPMRPYYYIHNNNLSTTLPTNKLSDTDVKTGLIGNGTDMDGLYKVTTFDGSGDDDNSNLQRTFKLGDNSTSVSLVEKPSAIRAGNASNVRCEIRYGKDDSLFQLVEVQIDYVKCPLFIRLTQEQIDLTEDTSQIMEFPDYVNQEIINELVHLVMERTADPRLSTNLLISLSIARPTGQLQPQTPAKE